jgi:carbon storage regulator
MLVLSRKQGEKVVIGNNITVTVAEIKGGRIRLAIEAPDHVRVLRGELACWLEEANDRQPATRSDRDEEIQADLVVGR